MNYLRFIKLGIISVIFSLKIAAQTQYTVVLDAGHGGKDPGKIAFKKYVEKDIALSIVLKVGNFLKKKGVKVIYTRKKDVFVTLKKRGHIANKADADLFISIHCNAHYSEAMGTETWVLSTRANSKNFEVAKAENEVIFLESNYQEKYKNFDPNSPTSTIGLTLQQEENLDQSILFASFVQGQFKNTLKRKDRGVKQNIFVVLHQTYMPSVLIEVGFITNKKEAVFLNSKKGKKQIAQSICKAILQYFEYVKMNRIPEHKIKNEIYYKIQMASSSKKIAPKHYNFKGLQPIERIKIGKYYKYYLGKVKKYKKAKLLLKIAKSKGYESAFIAAFENGTKISIHQALQKQKSNSH